MNLNQRSCIHTDKHHSRLDHCYIISCHPHHSPFSLSTTTPLGAYTYSYLPNTSQISAISAPGGIENSYAYDGPFVTQESISTPLFSATLNTTLNSDFRAQNIQINSTNIPFQFDRDGLLTQAGDISFNFDQNALLTSSSIGSIQDEYTYNSFGEPLSYSSGSFFAQTFVRDSLGRISQKTDVKGPISTTWNYIYDSSGRLSEVHKDGALVSRYTFDMNGNRLEKLSPQGSILASFDEQDRILTSGSLSFSYNNNGDLASYSDSSQSPTQFYSFDYDVFGNLRGVQLPNGDTIEYMIDGQNRRVGKKLNGSLVQAFIYQDQLNPIAELDGSGSVKSIFVYGSKAHVPDYMIQGPKKFKIISDHLGSVRMVIDLSSNSVVQEIDYDEYGVVLSDSNPGFQPFGFAGGITDQHTNLVRFGARDYMAEVGRWTAKDPIGFNGGDSNLFGYVGGQPTIPIDPKGTGPITGALCFGAAIVTARGLRLEAGKILSEKLTQIEKKVAELEQPQNKGCGVDDRAAKIKALKSQKTKAYLMFAADIAAINIGYQIASRACLLVAVNPALP